MAKPAEEVVEAGVGGSAPAVQQHRGGFLETTHPFSATICGPQEGVRQFGPELHTVTWRSSAKPFQLLVSGGLIGDLWHQLSDAQIALGAASHTGEPRHIDQLRQLMHLFEVDEQQLYCGTAWPKAPYGYDLAKVGEASPVHHGCSGKHIFLAKACAVQGWPADYRPVEHPLQQRIRAEIENRTATSVRNCIDGCGIPCWVLGLRDMARSWRRLGCIMHSVRGHGPAGEEKPTHDDSHRLAQIGWAMHSQPFFYSGSEQLDACVVRAASSPLLVKMGAGGLVCGTVIDEGSKEVSGFAIKVHSGNTAASAVATGGLLARFFPQLLTEQAVRRFARVLNVAGDHVGERTMHWPEAI